MRISLTAHSSFSSMESNTSSIFIIQTLRFAMFRPICLALFFLLTNYNYSSSHWVYFAVIRIGSWCVEGERKTPTNIDDVAVPDAKVRSARVHRIILVDPSHSSSCLNYNRLNYSKLGIYNSYSARISTVDRRSARRRRTTS